MNIYILFKRNIFFVSKIIFIFFLTIFSSCKSDKVVHLYTSLDYEYSKPIIDLFTKETGIKVKTNFDTEATKTIGLVNRLLAEKNNPQCDVFWNNEILRTLHLKKNGVFDKYISPNSQTIPQIYKDAEGYWTGFAARIRVIVYNKNKFNNTSSLPSSINDLLNPEWRGKSAISNPLIGTSATHTAALYLLWGREKTAKFFNDISNNETKILPGNSVVCDYCNDGIILWGFTDSDDVVLRILNNKNVGFIIPDQKEEEMGTLLIPNTLSLIKGAPHPENAKKLIDFLLSEKVEKLLSECPSAQIPLHKNISSSSMLPELSKIKIMDIDYSELYEKVDEIEEFIKEIYSKIP